MTAPCRLTGLLIGPDGEALPNQAFAFYPLSGISGVEAGVVVPNVKAGVSGEDASLPDSLELYPGPYELRIKTSRATHVTTVQVPEAASVALADLLPSVAEPVVAAWLVKGRAWADAAEDVEVEAGKFSGRHWSAKAEGFAGEAGGFRDDTLAIFGDASAVAAAVTAAQAAQTGAETAETSAAASATTAAEAPRADATVYRVPMIGRLQNGTANRFGVLVDAEARGQPGKKFTVPMMRSARALDVSRETLAAVRYEEAATKIRHGEVLSRLALNAVEGHALPQVWVRRRPTICQPITAGPYAADLVSYTDDGTTITAKVRRNGDVQEAKARSAVLGAAWADKPRKYRLILVFGQSPAQGHIDSGSDPVPPYRGLGPENAWMYDSAAVDGIDRGPRVLQVAPVASFRNTVAPDAAFDKIVRLKEATHGQNLVQGPTVCTPAAYALHGPHISWLDHTIWCVVGTGATAIADFASGTEHFQTMQKAIQAAAERVAAYEANNTAPNTSDLFELEVFSVSQQGEQDNSAGTAQATYVAAYQAIITALTFEVASAASTHSIVASYAGHTILQTMHSTGGGVVGMATLGQAELIRGGDAEGVAVYPMLPGANATHLLPDTYMPLGSALAYSIAQQIAGATPTPFVADGGAVLESATQTRCTITGGTGAFEFDTATIPNTADGNYGITMLDDLGALAVSAVTIESGNEVVITHASTTIGDNPRVRFGIAGSSQLPASTGPRVNIRDNSEWPCAMTGQIVSGWLIAHQVNCTV